MKIMKCDARAFARCPYKKQCSDSPEHTSFYEGTECDYFNQQVIHAPLTNADRIRAMSDEELAEFLILSPEMEFDVCRFCEYGNTSGDDRGICLTKDGICRAEANCAAFKKWLRQPAEEAT